MLRPSNNGKARVQKLIVAFRNNGRNYIPHTQAGSLVLINILTKNLKVRSRTRGRLEVLASIARTPVDFAANIIPSFLKTSDNYMGNDYIHEWFQGSIASYKYFTIFVHILFCMVWSYMVSTRKVAY